MAMFGNSFVRINLNWPEFKGVVDSKRLQLQYESTTDGYEIFAFDNDILYSARIRKHEVEYTSNIDQATNDSYKQDFIDNYKPSANQISSFSSELVDGYGTPLAVKDGDKMPGGQPGIMLMAKDGYEPTNVRALSTVRDGPIHRLAVNSRLVPGSSVTVGVALPENVSNFLSIPLTDSDDNTNLIVDGSSTPKIFSVKAPSLADGYDISIGEIRLVISTQDFVFNGNSFGSKSALTNGIEIKIISNANELIVIKININEDFLFFPSPTGMTLNNTGPKDIMVASIMLGNTASLFRDTSDVVKITINDNLTGSGATAFNYFQARLYGIKVNI